MTPPPIITLDCIILGLQRFGGISNYWYQLIRNLEPRQDIELLLPKHIKYRDFDPIYAGGHVVHQDALAPHLARYLPAAVTPGSQVFHTPYYRLPARTVKKYIVTAHDFTYERYRHGPARWLHSVQKGWSIRRADAVLCVSESTRADALEFCSGVDPAALHVIPLGVDSSTFFPEPNVRTCQGELSDLVLFVGQRGGYKRFDLAVDAVRAVSDLRLGVVGPNLSAAEKVDLSAKLGNRWHEFGPVSNTVLRRLYSAAFAFIFPSDYEGFGLPVLEAMACGCPVLAAGRSSLPEVGGDSALYAPTQSVDAYAFNLTRLLSSSAREDRRIAGLARASAFSWARTLQETAAHYVV